jgi:hypothetical protein
MEKTSWGVKNSRADVSVELFTVSLQECGSIFELSAKGRAVERVEYTTIHMNRISGQVQFWGLVVVGRTRTKKDLPNVKWNTITSFAAVDSGKVERAVNVCILMSEVHPLAEREVAFTSCSMFGCVRGTN